MSPDGLLAALGGVINVVLLFVSCFIYLALTRQIASRIAVTEPVTDAPPAKVFGLPEAIVASVFIFILVLGVFNAPPDHMEVDTRVLLENLLVSLAVILFIVALLLFRGFNLNELAGLTRLSFVRAVSTGVVLLLASYPLVAFADNITQLVLGGGSSRQSIVEQFSGSSTIDQKTLIIVFAVAFAPIVEEFLFRFFIYGVLRRYFGRFFGLVFNSVLFGAVHTHLPSFAPLVVLGVCLTIAYEWSGSILVSMTIHSLFNALSLTALAFPELISQ